MRRRWWVRALVALVATLAMIGGAVPASADVPPWPGIPCTGGIDIARVDSADREVNLTLEGHLECAPEKGQVATYGYARYLDGYHIGMLRPDDLRPYDGAAPLRFVETRNVAGPMEVAYCVVTTETTRVGCVKVTRAAPDYLPVLETLPTDSPLVSWPARVVNDEAWTNPGCGGCW